MVRKSKTTQNLLETSRDWQDEDKHELIVLPRDLFFMKNKSHKKRNPIKRLPDDPERVKASPAVPIPKPKPVEKPVPKPKPRKKKTDLPRTETPPKKKKATPKKKAGPLIPPSPELKADVEVKAEVQTKASSPTSGTDKKDTKMPIQKDKKRPKPPRIQLDNTSAPLVPMPAAVKPSWRVAKPAVHQVKDDCPDEVIQAYVAWMNNPMILPEADQGPEVHKCLASCVFRQIPSLSTDSSLDHRVFFICQVSGNIHSCGSQICLYISCTEAQTICSLTGVVLSNDMSYMADPTSKVLTHVRHVSSSVVKRKT